MPSSATLGLEAPRVLPRHFLVPLLVLLSCAVRASGAPDSLHVEHASGQAVYVSAGELDGLRPGDSLEVHRDGQPVALLEVVRTTEHTAFCRLVHQFLPVEPGDRVLASTYDELTVTEEAELLPPPDEPRGLDRLVELERRHSEVREPSLTGAASFRTQLRSTGKGELERSSSETTARISVAGRDLGGRPLTFRVRARARQRKRDSGSSSTLSDQRFYELSLRWEPTDSRSWWQLGRIGSRQETGTGYLDGVAGQLALGRRWGFGGFAGLNPEVDEDLFGTSDTKLGAFVTWATPRGPGRYGEVLLSAIGEYVPDGLSREYLFLQSRFGDRGRWSFYQQAELDLNRDWRREAGASATQLSNLSLSASFRISDRLRGSLSYDARRRYRDDDTRDVPEEAFDRFLREGWRGTLFYRSPGGLGLSVGAGLRGGEGDVDSVDSFVVSANHGNLFGSRILLGGDFSSFRSETGDGYLATLRARKSFRRGHDVGLTLGQSSSRSEIGGENLDLRWLRFDGTLQLPYRLFLLVEIEVGMSDGAETRQMLQLGTRF